MQCEMATMPKPTRSSGEEFSETAMGALIQEHNCETNQQGSQWWWRNPPIDRDTVKQSRKRWCRRYSSGAGIPRASRGDGWHPPAPRVTLPYLEGMTDENGDLLHGKASKFGLRKIRDHEVGRASEPSSDGGGDARLILVSDLHLSQKRFRIRGFKYLWI